MHVDERIHRFLEKELPGAGARGIRKLKGDASTREYFRCGVSESETAILTLYPEPFDPAESTYLQVYRMLRRIGLPIPRIHAVDGDLGRGAAGRPGGHDPGAAPARDGTPGAESAAGSGRRAPDRPPARGTPGGGPGLAGAATGLRSGETDLGAPVLPASLPGRLLFPACGTRETRVRVPGALQRARRGRAIRLPPGTTRSGT